MGSINDFLKDSNKLFRVTLRGSSISNCFNNTSYAVAPDPTAAYEKVRTFLDKNDIGFVKERELDKVELIADSYRYNNVGLMLFL